MHKKFSSPFSKKTGRSSKMFSKVILVLFLSSSTMTFAQIGFDDDVNDQVEETPAASIDSGLVLLTSLGLALGIYMLKKNEALNSTKI